MRLETNLPMQIKHWYDCNVTATWHRCESLLHKDFGPCAPLWTCTWAVGCCDECQHPDAARGSLLKAIIVFCIVSLSTVLLIGCASPTPAPAPVAVSTTAPASTDALTPTPEHTVTPEPAPTLVDVSTAALASTDALTPTSEHTVTPEPAPTLVAVSTTAPASTDALTPTSEHTATLEPAPTSTITPTPILSAWTSLGVEQDRLTDELSVSFYTKAISHDIEPQYGVPKLIVRCSSSDEPLMEDYSWAELVGGPTKVLDGPIRVFVHWGGQYIGGDNDRPDVGIRFDSHPALFEYWYESPDNEAAYTPYPNDFVYRANQAEAVYIQLTDFSGEKFVAEFDLQGLVDVMADHPDLCQMPDIVIEEGDFGHPGGPGISFDFFATEYEPVFALGIPALDFLCFRNNQKNVFFRMNLAGSHRSDERGLYDMSGITAQFDSQSPYEISWGAGRRLDPSQLASFIHNARDARVVIIRATLGDGSEMRADFDISGLRDLMDSYQYCN